MPSDDLPDLFVAQWGGIWKAYKATAYRTSIEGRWYMEVTVSIPMIGPIVRHAPRPVDEDHVRHIYENYTVVREE